MNPKPCALLMALFFCKTVSSQIWLNPVNGTAPDYPSLYNPFTIGQTVAPNLIVSGIGRGTGLIAEYTNNRYNAKGWTSALHDTADYFYFSLNPDAGYKISFISFAYTGQASSTGPVSFALRSSLDGYTGDIGLVLVNGTLVTIDLSDPAYQDIATPITFRMYGWAATGEGGTFSINDFRFNGSITPVSGSVSYATDYFRSVTSGSWNSASTWESSHDNVSYFTATVFPDQFAAGVEITNGHTVTMAAPAFSKHLIISSGGTLVNPSAYLLSIYNGVPGNADFIVNGTYILNGRQPEMYNDAICMINGTVKVNDNTGGESDNFARNNKVTFTNNSLFEWNTATTFETASAGQPLIYFPNSAIGTIPVFRITANTGNIGAANTTVFQCRFEVTGSVSFINQGTKVFRDGLGGTGIITHKHTGAFNDCGTFLVGDFFSGITNPVIDGTITINIENTNIGADIEIGKNASVTINGNPVINIGTPAAAGAVLLVSGKLLHNSAMPVLLNNGHLTINGAIDGPGNYSASSVNTVLTVSRTTSGNAGVLRLLPGANTVKDFVMGETASNTCSRITLGSAVNIAGNLSLVAGIIVTGDNLLTFNNTGGTVTYPPLGGSTHANSFIATCMEDGSPLSFPLPFNGLKGFRINNISGPIDQVFPVGATYLSSGTFAATPNRMLINNMGTADNFTVVVQKQLLNNTPLPGINRVWYVKEGTDGGSKVSMQLYFTKKDWAGYPDTQDEVETGFIYNDPHLVQQDYTGAFINNAAGPAPPAGDVPDYTSAVFDGREIAAQYSQGISADNAGNVDGLQKFTRFAIFNASGIVLPAVVTQIKAFQQAGKVAVHWAAVQELNIDYYEVERSEDAINFKCIQSVRVDDMHQNNYHVSDTAPVQGINYYRIAVVDKNGKRSYTAVAKVNVGIDAAAYAAVAPNPVQNRLLYLKLAGAIPGSYAITLINGKGQPVFNTIIQHDGRCAAQAIVLPASVCTGIYTLYIRSGVHRFSLHIVIM